MHVIREYMTVTLVTSLINYYHVPLNVSTWKRRFSYLNRLLDVKIPTVIYVSPDGAKLLETHILTYYHNHDCVKIVPLAKHFFESSSTFLTTMKHRSLNMPKERLIPKDTLEYMIYQNSKIEFLYQLIKINPFKTNHFMWCDYDISKMWKDISQCVRKLRFINTNGIANLTHLPPTEHEPSKKISQNDQIYFPGCWDKHEWQSEDLCKKISWRFAGTFILGSIESIINLYSLYTEYYDSFLCKYETIVWDVNFYTYLEGKTNWNPIVYKADHNDSIINIPSFAYATRLFSLTNEQITLTYPLIEGYYPSSSSYLEYEENGETIKVCNVRYVNYYYLPSGHCTLSEDGKVCTKNLMISINEKGMNDIKKQSHLIREDEMGVPKPDPNEQFQGVEDIRLYRHENKTKFLATSVNYSGRATNAMLMGDYDTETFSLKNVKVLESPGENIREKNWIPFVSQKEPDKLYFIYQWASPFQIGALIEESRLQIRYTYPVSFPMQEEIRGSSNLVLDPHMGKYVALVHISVENTLPKQYYHMLVWLDPITYRPCAHSKLIYFWKFGVEFCLNMEIKDEGGQYGFWFSTMDRDPRYVSIDRTFFTGSMQEYVFSV